MELADVDLLDLDRFARNQHHELFDVLRREDPVHWSDEPDGTGFWSVTRHADVGRVNRDSALFSSEVGGTQRVDPSPDATFDTRGLMMLDTDPPKHTRYRLLVNKGFTPRMIGLLEQHLRYRAELIVDSVIESGTCDFVSQVAAELPLQAIAEIMGVPQEDRHLIFDWTNRLVGTQDPELSGGDPTSGIQAAGELWAYANKLGAARRDDPRDDIATLLINAEIQGDRLTEVEFDMFMLLLAVAGSETTRNATAHGMHALLTNPEQFDKLKTDPEGLLDNAIEEILRWATPVLHFRRTATADTRVGDREIAAGQKVLIWHISANRDEAVFDDPHTFDVTRPNASEHIAFGGGGAHFCLGANLARAEMRIMFAELLERVPSMQLAGEPQRLRSNFLGGIKHMPVSFQPGPRRHPEASG